MDTKVQTDRLAGGGNLGFGARNQYEFRRGGRGLIVFRRNTNK